jgi:hypothetical protein
LVSPCLGAGAFRKGPFSAYQKNFFIKILIPWQLRVDQIAKSGLQRSYMENPDKKTYAVFDVRLCFPAAGFFAL